MAISKIVANAAENVSKIDIPKTTSKKIILSTASIDASPKLQGQLDALAQTAKANVVHMKSPQSLEDALYITGYMDKVKFIPDAQNLLPKPISAAEQISKFYRKS